jgi:hypothetical protein
MNHHNHKESGSVPSAEATKRKKRKRQRATTKDDDSSAATSTIAAAATAATATSRTTTTSTTATTTTIPWNANNYSYPVDYNDHFETPQQAYMDILPVLDCIQPSRKHHVLYDPYYCHGQTKRLLQNRLGFDNVQHEKRDFYRDIRDGTVPPFDTLVTNPPYSDRHKEQCLEYCAATGKPFLLLMPCYVASKQYFKQIILNHDNNNYDDNGNHNDSGNNDDATMFYIVPHVQYQYSHPDGTGHATSPFDSMWFVGGLSKEIQSKIIQKVMGFSSKKNNQNSSPAAPTTTTATITLYTSHSQLIQAKIISVHNRPNPRQRQKKNKKKQKIIQQQQQQQEEQQESTSALASVQQQSLLSNTSSTTTTTTPAAAAAGAVTNDKSMRPNNNNNNNSSKYRDPVTGKRRKKRF